MANVLVDEVSLQNIGNSIRNKKGVSTLYKPAEMASAIDSIPTQRSKWWLPPDIPDIFDLWLPENGDTYGSYCYWVLDTKVPTDEVKKITLKNSMSSLLSTVNIAIGHIISGIFVGDILESTQLTHNETYEFDYSNCYEQYIVVRVYSGTIGIWNPITSLIADEYHTSISTIPVISISYFGQEQYQIHDGFVFNFLKYLKLKTPYSVGRLGVQKDVHTLEYLDYKDCYSFADGGRWLLNAYSGYRSLKIFEFPSLPMYTEQQSSTLNSSTFSNCENLFELDLHNLAIPPMPQWINAFNGCSSLKKINISTWNMTDFTIHDSMFTGCSALDTIICEHTIFPSTSFKLNFSNRLTVDTLLNVINALPTISEGTTTPTLTLGTTNIAKLTAEQIQIATDKGWIVA